MIPEPFAHALAPQHWPLFAFVLTRVSGFMLSAPLWSMSDLPRAARAAITVLLSGLLLPLAPAVALPEHVLDVPLPLATEMLIGLVIGLTAAVLVQGVALAGEVVSLQMGLTLGPSLAPTPDVPVSGVGQVTTLLALLIYLATGGHLMLLRGLADSLQIVPPGSPIDLAGGAHAAALMARELFVCAIRAAAPVMVTLLLVNVALAILSRAVPQLNAMMVSLPVTFSIGLVMLGVALPIMSTTIAGWMHDLPVQIERTLRAFQPS